MKRVTASEARRNWFRILDEVAGGAVVMVERNGRRILIQRAEEGDESGEIPDYEAILRVRDPGSADRWGWEWPGPEEELRPMEEDLRPAEGNPGLSDEDEVPEGSEQP